jgi:intracellular septation protein
MQLLMEFFPLIAFFVAFVAFDLYVATATIIVAMGLQIAYQWFRHRKVNKMLLVSGALVAVFGGLTLALRDPNFIKWKVTVVNWLFAAGFLGSQLFSEKTFTERVMGQAAELDKAMWRRLNMIWVVHFGAIGALNLYVMENFDDNVWAAFKVWGVIALTLLVAVGQAIWISSRATTDPGAAGPGSGPGSGPSS